MFSTGQLIFAILFAIGFAIAIAIAYKKDKNLHQKNYSGVRWIGILFLIFVLILFFIKYFLKN